MSAPVWRVYVLEPLQHRQRKHTVLFYRVGRATKEEAIEAVRSEVMGDPDRPGRDGMRIVACTLLGDYGGIVCDGVVHWDKERAESMPTL